MTNNHKIEFIVRGLMESYALHQAGAENMQEHINALWNRLLMHGYKIDEAAALNNVYPANGISALTYRIHLHRFQNSPDAYQQTLEQMNTVFTAVKNEATLGELVKLTDYVEDVFCALIDLKRPFAADDIQQAFYEVWSESKGLPTAWDDEGCTSTETVAIIDEQLNEVEVVIDELLAGNVTALPDGSCPVCYVRERLESLISKLVEDADAVEAA